MQVTIGKFALESLTMGMYSDPLVIFREYIQNAVDSLDEAVDRRMITLSEGRIDVIISRVERRIVIEDNGCGIPEWQAPRLLLDIGNSRKRELNARGFRGIGRLAGLGHAKSVSFQTSFSGEECATVLYFDAEKLQQMMLPGQAEGLDLVALLEKATHISTQPEKNEAHYFRVTLEHIQQDELLDVKAIRDYLCENAPLPYDPQLFSWGSAIQQAFADRRLELKEYSVYLCEETGEEQLLFKPFRDQFLVDKQKKLLDQIEDIEVFDIRDNQGTVLALAWVGRSQLLGGILNPLIRGLRFRKGNILIGGRTTLNGLFKEERFNGWFQGEIFVLDRRLIPNARRDDFERNSAYAEILLALEQFCNDLSRTVRQVSADRNAWKKQSLCDKKDLKEDAGKAFELYDKELSGAIKGLDALQSLQKLSGDRAATRYSALNIAQRMTMAEKKALETVFDVLLEELGAEKGEQVILKLVRRLKVVE